MKVKRSLTYFKVPRACPWVSTISFRPDQGFRSKRDQDFFSGPDPVVTDLPGDGIDCDLPL